MRSWEDRTYEERHLLNPAFCSLLLWHAAKGSSKEAVSPRVSLSYLEAFLVLPLILHQQSRESLPKRLTTSMPVWIDSQPLVITALPQRARSTNDFTREAILFGGTAGLFDIEKNSILVNEDRAKDINKILKQTSDEVRTCMKKSEFLGRWFAHTGTPETVFTLLGVRP
ncbi:MAG: three component ABC system middle component [Candidatus Thiodiazotropha taylori]